MPESLHPIRDFRNTIFFLIFRLAQSGISPPFLLTFGLVQSKMIYLFFIFELV